MHDGSLATLEEVVDFYSGGGRPNPSLDPEIRPPQFESRGRAGTDRVSPLAHGLPHFPGASCSRIRTPRLQPGARGLGTHILVIYRLSIYDTLMIRSFRCAETEKIFQGKHSRKFQSIEKPGLRKLIQLNQAQKPPGSSLPRPLEALSKESAGQHAIRINEKYRLCFVWNNSEASDAEIVDYH
jgi:proteic killer suppression protein